MTKFLHVKHIDFYARATRLIVLLSSAIFTWVQHEALAGLRGANGLGIPQEGGKGAFAHGACGSWMYDIAGVVIVLCCSDTRVIVRARFDC